jgi:tetratricopeptide (TPR) repeat protein
VEQKIKDANEMYKEKKYESAITIYEKLIDSGIISSSVYYNLGNSYFRIGKLGLSVLNYERALKLNPHDEDIIHNLEFVNSRITDKVESIPQFFLFGWWESLISILSIDVLTFVGYGLYLIAIVFLLLFTFNKSARVKRKIFFTLAPIIVIMVFIIITIIGKMGYEAVNQFGVIIDSRISVKNSPDEKGSDLFILNEGLKIKIEDNVDNWTKIRLADGKVGWVQKSNIIKI